jgi:hypothetical protein
MEESTSWRVVAAGVSGVRDRPYRVQGAQVVGPAVGALACRKKAALRHHVAPAVQAAAPELARARAHARETQFVFLVRCAHVVLDRSNERYRKRRDICSGWADGRSGGSRVRLNRPLDSPSEHRVACAIPRTYEAPRRPPKQLAQTGAVDREHAGVAKPS